MSNAAKRYSIVLLLISCLLLSGCQKSIVSIFTSSEHTELVVDGEYKPFNVPRATMEKLMELIEAEDADYIYEVFSPAVRESVAGLDEQIQEFICFIKEKVTDWDFSTGIGDVQRQDGVTTSTRSSFYDFNTNSGSYRCDLGEVLKDTVHPALVGFSDITVYPEELSWEYAPKKPSGIYIVYRIGDLPQNTSVDTASMETLMQLAGAKDTNGISELFSTTAKRHSKELQEKLPELVYFLSGQVTSWESYTWTENVEKFNGDMATVKGCRFNRLEDIAFQDLSRPFMLEEAWIWENDDRDEETIKAEMENGVYQGNIELINLGDNLSYNLIVTGKCQGEVWNFSDVGVQPCCERQDFLGWFELWLDCQDETDYFKDYIYE